MLISTVLLICWTLDRLDYWHVSTDTGHWWVHPDTNKSWSNYTSCIDLKDVSFRQVINKITVSGLAVSTLFLIISLLILSCFKSLRCARNNVHINMFISMSLNNISWLLWYFLVLFNPDVWSQNPAWCRVLHVITTYFMISTYFWMMCEGAFLRMLAIKMVIREGVLVARLMMIGWLTPALLVIPYSVYRYKYENDICWMDHGESMVFLALPVIIVILINIYFLWSVVLVIRNKIQFQNNFNRSTDVTMKSAKAVLILVPIFGIHFILMPMRPEPGSSIEYIYEVKLGKLSPILLSSDEYKKISFSCHYHKKFLS